MSIHYNIATGVNGAGDDYAYLEWTTEPPTQEGWYWVCLLLDGGNVTTILHAPFDKKTFDDFRRADKVYWIGPLPVPEPPQKED